MRKRVDRVPSRPMYTETFAQFKKRLGQLDKWLGVAADYAKSKNFDPDVFATLRLAPDQLALERQAQIACDTVKQGHSYLTEKPRSRGKTTRRPRRTADARSIDHHAAGRRDREDFEGTAIRVVSQPRWKANG